MAMMMFLQCISMIMGDRAQMITREPFSLDKAQHIATCDDEENKKTKNKTISGCHRDLGVPLFSLSRPSVALTISSFTRGALINLSVLG